MVQMSDLPLLFDLVAKTLTIYQERIMRLAGTLIGTLVTTVKEEKYFTVIFLHIVLCI